MKPERRARDRGPVCPSPRAESRPAIDPLRLPDLASRPPVADWLVFLAEQLAAEAMREFVDPGGIR